MTCPKCKRPQPAENFAVDRSKASGRKSHCKDCDNDKSRAYYRDHREQKLQTVKARQARLREEGAKNPLYPPIAGRGRRRKAVISPIDKGL